MTEHVSAPNPDPAREGRTSPSPADTSQPGGAPAATPASRQGPLLKGLVLCLAVIVLGWLLYRAPLARELTVRGAAQLGPRSVPLLRHALGDEDQGVKRAAAESLVDLGAACVPVLSESLTDRDPQVRAHSALGLSLLGVQGQAAVAALLPVTEDADAQVRRQALRALCAVSAYGEVALPVVRKALEDPDPEVCAFAAEALGRFSRPTSRAGDAPSDADQAAPPVIP